MKGLKTLHTYLTRETLASLLMTVMVFTFVLLLGNALKELLPLLVHGQVSLGFVAQSLGLLVPFVWVFALPMGMLTATLLIFGRFSADQEYTAVRASGISLLTLSTPILLLSIALCGISALVKYGSWVHAAGWHTRRCCCVCKRNLQPATCLSGTPIKDFQDYIFYIGKNVKGDLQDVWIFKLQNETNVEQTVHARRGKLEVDAVNKKLMLTLYDGQGLVMTGNQPAGSFEETSIEFSPKQQKERVQRAQVDDLSFSQLREELAEWERRLSLPMSVKHLTPEQRLARKKEFERARREFISPMLFQMHRQVAFSFACFGFTLVGIPLGIRVHRRETNIGIALALILVAIYYSFILVGQSLSGRPEYLPHLLVWIPNFLFQSAGVVLLWRANRGL